MFEETGRNRADSRRSRKGSPSEKAAAPRKNNRASSSRSGISARERDRKRHGSQAQDSLPVLSESRRQERKTMRELPPVSHASGQEMIPVQRQSARGDLAVRRDASIQRTPARRERRPARIQREEPSSLSRVRPPSSPARRDPPSSLSYVRPPSTPARRRDPSSSLTRPPSSRGVRRSARRRRTSRRWVWPFQWEWPFRLRRLFRRKTSRRRNTERRRRRYPSARARLTRRIALGAFTAVLLLLCTVWSANHLLFQKPEIPKAETTAAYLPPLVFPPAEEEEDSPPAIAASVSDAAAHQKRKKDFYTILIAGADQNNGGSDTIILTAFDAVNGHIYGVSIPRDTKTTTAGSIRKMNAAYRIGGMPLLSSTVSNHLGIPVDYTVEVNLDGFAALVDAIGGVEFDVPLDMDYDDEAQDLYIHVSKGLQVVRFRHNNDGSGYGNEDLGRIATQQKFLKAVARKLLSPQSLFKLDDCAKIFRQYVDTELTVRNLMWFGREALSIGVEGIEFSTLPGSWKYPYIYTDKEAALDVINAHLNPYEEDRRAEDLHIPS